MSENSKQYDLEERTSKFGEEIIKLVKLIRSSNINNPIINQLVKCGTSIGANYMETNGAESKKDFIHKINICKKESRGTKHFLRMIVAANPEINEQAKVLWKEAHELTLIFGAITRKK